MFACDLCQKNIRKVACSKHKKGSSGASQWPLRAPIHIRAQKPNLHNYHGMKFCTKCLRSVRSAVKGSRKVEQTVTPVSPTPAVS